MWTGRAPIAPYPWDGDPDYFCRAIDQGIGRALWFIHGADTGKVAAAVAAFDRHRQADLWSGVGLAATFAGGGQPAELAALVQVAGEHAAELALGSVFAVKARTYAGFVPQHTVSAAARVHRAVHRAGHRDRRQHRGARPDLVQRAAL